MFTFCNVHTHTRTHTHIHEPKSFGRKRKKKKKNTHTVVDKKRACTIYIVIVSQTRVNNCQRKRRRGIERWAHVYVIKIKPNSKKASEEKKKQTLNRIRYTKILTEFISKC